MRFLALILAFAVAATSLGAGRAILDARQVADHGCCDSEQQPPQKQDGHDCGGACLMVCCRTVTTPAEPAATPLELADTAAAIALPPALAHELGDPQSIFHPPRA